MTYEEFKKGRTPKPGEVITVASEGQMKDVIWSDKKQEAMRYDGDKTDWSLLPTDGLRALADHYTRGAKKYAARNWELGMAYSRCYNSLNRHLSAWWEGEDWDVDEKTGARALHLVAVVWNAMALLVYTLRGAGTDDRPKIRIPQNGAQPHPDLFK